MGHFLQFLTNFRHFRLYKASDGLENKSPSRIILDNKLKISLRSKVIKDSYKHRTIIFYNKINKKKIPLMTALLNAITKNKKLKIKY